MFRHTSTADKRDQIMFNKRWLLTIAVLVLFLIPTARGASAQSDTIVWSEQFNLSNTPQSSGRPAIVADHLGYVHVFWSEEVGGDPIIDIPDELIHTGNTIYYSRWDGKSWTQPVDILYVPGDDVADYIAVSVDDKNWLHVVWTGQSDFYYSKAPAWQADSAHSWSTPVIVASDSARSQWESDIVAGADGSVDIVYATRGDDPGIYHIRSQDRGATWGPRVKISEPLDPLEDSFSNARIAKDGVGRLHVVWQTNQKEGYGQSAYYARSTNGGTTWSKPFRLGYKQPTDYGVAFPVIACIGDSEVHLIYIGGPWHIGRYHRISRDGGETWSEPYHILTDMEGVNGYVIPLVDSAGGMHLVINMRTRTTQLGGLYYARWLGTEWSPVTPIATEPLLVPGAHWTAAVMSLGNEIHVVWNSNFTRGAGEIGYIQGKIPGIPQLPAAAVPKADAVASGTPVSIPSQSTSSSTAPVQPLPAVGPDQPSLTGLSEPPASAGASGGPLLSAVVAALLLVGGVIVVTLTSSRRKLKR